MIGEKALMDHDSAMALDSLDLFQGCVLSLLHQHQGYLVSAAALQRTESAAASFLEKGRQAYKLHKQGTWYISLYHTLVLVYFTFVYFR